MNRRSFFGLAAGLTAGAVTSPAMAMIGDMKKQIKITGIETDLLRFPPGKITYDAIHTFGTEGGSIALRVKTDAGITGYASTTFGTMLGAPKVLQDILHEEVKPVLIGQDPSFPRKIRSDLWKALEYAGMQGMNEFAVSAVDVAVWDILGKAANLPVYKMLGAYADSIPIYSMCGWYFPNDDDQSQFKRALNTAFEQGYTSAKIKVGRYSLADDAKRIKIAKDIAGPDREIMVDANQKFSVSEAIIRGKVYQEMGCFWYEEPIVPYDHAGYAKIAEELTIRVAGGENEYTKYSFADLIGRRGVDVVQPDIRRTGGVSEWMEIGAMADAAKLPLASHGGGATDLQMLLCMPNAIFMESEGSHKGSDGPSLENLKMVGSTILAPQLPGMGSEVRPEYIAKFKV